MDLLDTNEFYQYLADCLLNLIMHLFLLIQNLLLVIFYINDLEYMAALDYALCYFHFYNLKTNHLYLLSTSVLHAFPTLAPYGYDVFQSNAFRLLSSLLLPAILLISSVYTYCASFLNVCCNFNMISLIHKQFS